MGLKEVKLFFFDVLLKKFLAFWLGMIENGETADKEGVTDIDGNLLRYYDGWRSDQPSNKLNHPNDKHTIGLNEDCVRQKGHEGWNDAICTRTW